MSIVVHIYLIKVKMALTIEDKEFQLVEDPLENTNV